MASKAALAHSRSRPAVLFRDLNRSGTFGAFARDQLHDRSRSIESNSKCEGALIWRAKPLEP